MNKKILLPLFAFNALLLPSCSTIGGDAYQITSTGENHYTPAIEGLSKSYGQIKEEIPDLPMLIPGDVLKLEFDENGIAKKYNLDKTEMVKGYVTPAVGNMSRTLRLDDSFKWVNDYANSKQFVGLINDDLEICTDYQLYLKGIPADTAYYLTYRKAIESDEIDKGYEYYPFGLKKP